MQAGTPPRKPTPLRPHLAHRYANRSGNSGVVSYQIEGDVIALEFSDGHIYLYTPESAGSASIERMKELARSGKGLSGFVARHVRRRYAARIR